MIAPNVIANVQRFRTLRKGHKSTKPEIGVVFAGMRGNIADLPKVLKIVRQLSAIHLCQQRPARHRQSEE